MIPEIPLFKVHMPRTVAEPLLSTLFSGYVGEGPKVREFEESFARSVQHPHCLAVNSATSGIQLALRLAGVGPGDEVISTPATCVATNMPILAAGAEIVWGDVDPVSGNLCPQDVARKITPKTRAVIMVHWGGNPCDLEAFSALARANPNVRWIEDAAHALGATHGGVRIGSHSDFVVFSFQAIKHITTVDGGMVLCRRPEDHERGRLLRWYGIDRDAPRAADFRLEADIQEWGYKVHMNDMAAVIGIEQLKYLDGIVARHRENASRFHSEFKDLPGVRTVAPVPGAEPSWWIYTIHVESRDAFQAHMTANGVMASRVHWRNDVHTAFHRAAVSALPGVDAFYRTQCSIPVGWWLEPADCDRIIRLVHDFAAG